MLVRRKFIKNYLNEFIPHEISNLIIGYDYPLVRTFVHNYCYMSCCFILSDNRIVIGDNEGILTILHLAQAVLDVDTLEYKNTLEGEGEGHTALVNCCTVLTDNKIISGSCDNTLKIWNVETETCELTLRGHTDFVKCCI